MYSIEFKEIHLVVGGIPILFCGMTMLEGVPLMDDGVPLFDGVYLGIDWASLLLCKVVCLIQDVIHGMLIDGSWDRQR